MLFPLIRQRLRLFSSADSNAIGIVVFNEIVMRCRVDLIFVRFLRDLAN